MTDRGLAFSLVLDKEGQTRPGEGATLEASCRPHGLVFCRQDGSPLHPQAFTDAFDALVGKAGLPRIRLHDLRHSHATIALRAGVPVKVVSERLGHSTPAFTLKVYAHAVPGMQAEAAARIAGLVDRACTPELAG